MSIFNILKNIDYNKNMVFIHLIDGIEIRTTMSDTTSVVECEDGFLMIKSGENCYYFRPNSIISISTVVIGSHQKDS